MKMVTHTQITILLVLIFTLNILKPVSAQSDSKVIVARNLLQAKSADTKLGADELSTMKVSSETYSTKSGVTNIYFQQYINNIPVHGAILNAHITKNNELLTYGNRFVPLANAGIKGSAQPVLSPEQALKAALKSLNIKENGELAQKTAEDNSPVRLTVFDRGLIAIEDIKVQLVYQPVENMSQGVRLTWQVEIYTADAQNWWLARIDAETGELLDKTNYVNHCDFGTANAEECHHTHSADAPHRTYFEIDGDFPPQPHGMNPPPAALALNQYKVISQPYESPNHTSPAAPADGRVIISNPASPVSSPFGWHDNNGVAGSEFTTTQGNNVHAYTDTDANNLPDAGSSPDGGVDLVFIFPLDLTQVPSTYRPAAVTNLFYWNNYIHDFAYAYGFDEQNGNFQTNNYGNGGVGNDYVQAEAQDGSGTNNANFATPPDGQRPRMQMYIGINPVPDQDGDFDNAVIAHEYAHGISNRFTGGPANTSCLQNSEQMGEGWSDFYGLMMTMNPGDAGPEARGIGTYLFGQPANGIGIRPTPYSTDLTINPATYNTIKTSAVPHGVGYVWCGMIWDLTWAMIEDHGQTTGFDVAMNLINEGMKLQPCSPGFVDGRNAILAADLALYSGENRCRIWEVFARRGLGFSATQGSSGSVTDGTEAFDVPQFCLLGATPDVASGCVPNNVEYTLENGTGEALTLSVTGNPAGTTVSFSSNPIPDNSTSIMSVSTSGAASGTYNLTVTGTGSSNVLSTTVTLIIQNGVPEIPVLVSPADMAVNLANPLLTWNAVMSAETYELQLATDNAFTNIIVSAPGLTATNYQTAGLANLTAYFWRVKGINACGQGEFSEAFSFTTANIICNSFVSTNVPVTIPTTVATVTSTLNISGCGGSITDLNILGLNISHTWIDDLVIDLTSPGGTTVRLMNRPCNSEDNILINLDDEAAGPNFPCPPVNNGYYTPFAPLSAFDGENITGTWTLTVSDVVSQDGGLLNGWSLEICYVPEELICYLDQDNDNYGDPGNSQSFCDVCGDGYVVAAGDCDDNNSAVNPGAAEICGNGTDENCNSVVDENGAAPQAICKPYLAILSTTGQASVSASDVDNLSTYECGLQSMTVFPNTFTCADLGPNLVTLTVTDVNGNISTCQTTVTVVDQEVPAITTIAGALDATLDYTDVSGISAALALVPVATDNCSTVPDLHLISDNTVNNPGNGNEYVRTRVWNFTDGSSNTSSSFTQVITVTDGTPSTCTAAGFIRYEIWNNIGNSVAVSSLTGNINYPNNPTTSQLITSMEGITSQGDNYGSRIAGYICAPATGSYTFWIAGDDNVELWLSTDNQPANKQLIAYHTGFTWIREWNKYATQKSATINLVEGNSYYIEALMKEAGGVDNLAVGWLKPGQAGIVPSEVVPGSVLSPIGEIQPILVSSVSLPSSTTVAVGLQVLIPAIVLPVDAANQVLDWTSSDPGIAIVNSNGLVTGMSTGVVNITATSTDGSNQSGTCAVTVTESSPVCSAAGFVSYEIWNNIGSSVAVSSLTSNINYPNNPSSVQLITSMEGITSMGNNYGARIAGYICAPATGSYTFWIAADDNAELWLSIDEQPANKQKIAFHTGYTWIREWNKYPTQKSAVINLVQGQSYYIEALMKEAGGNDNLAVGWLKPGQAGTVPSEVVPGSVLSPLGEIPPIFVSSVNLPVSTSVAVGLQVLIPATVLPVDADNPVLDWATSDPGIATVNSSGLVTGISTGVVNITATSTDGTNISDACVVTVDETPPMCAATGFVSYEVWNNIGSSIAVSSLTGNVNYPDNPSTSQQITSMEGTTNLGENYGARIAGYICAPATGSYTFWIAADDNAELWLSIDNQPENKQKIAFHTGYTWIREWNKYATQKSAVINLVQGHSYYIEALMKEAGGIDNLAVGWLKPGQSGTVPSEVIPGSVLSPLPAQAKIGSSNIGNSSLSENDVKLLVYPNPLANTILNIEVENLSTVATLKIFTASGVACYEGLIDSSGTVQLDRSVFKNGIYIIKVYNEHFVKTTKLIVN